MAPGGRLGRNEEQEQRRDQGSRRKKEETPGPVAGTWGAPGYLGGTLGRGQNVVCGPVTLGGRTGAGKL